MPLVRLEVSNEYGLGAPEMYIAANDDEPKEIMEGVAVAGLVGLLRQLGDLADFAADVFHGLQEQVTITCSRSYKLMGRIQRIEAALAPVEKAVLAQRSHLHLAYTAGVNWHAPDRCEKNHFLYSDMPQFILDSYEDCRNPPHFHLLDRFDPGGPGSCLKRYSDPTIFSKASEASAHANTHKVAIDMKVQKRKTLRSNVGGPTPPFQPISSYYAALRPGLYEQSNLDQRNGSGCSKDDICPSYTMQQKEEESRGFIQKSHGSDDIQINPTQEQGVSSSYSCTRSEKTCLIYETSDRLDVQTCDQSLRTSGSGVIHLEDFFESVTDHFMDAPDTIEPESKTGGIYCMRKQDLDNFSKLEDRAASGRVPAKYEYNSVSSAEKYFLSAQMSGSSLNPSSKKSICSSGNGGITDSMNKESISCRVSSKFSDNGLGMEIVGNTKSSQEPEKAVPETSDVTSVVFWTNGGLLGLQPSKPPLCSVLLDDLPQYCLSKEDVKSSSLTQHAIFCDRDPRKPDETNSFQNIQEGLAMDSPPTCQEYQESDESLREKFWKKIPADADFKLGRAGNLLHPHCANSSGATVLAISTSFLSVNSEFQAARNHPEIDGNSFRDNQLRDVEEDSSHANNLNASAYEQKKHQNSVYQTFPRRTEDLSGDGYLMQSPCPSPPLAHMKISVRPMDGFKASKLKLRFMDGDIINQGNIDIFPTFQLVPEVSITRLNVGSDSDDDTFSRSPPSSSDGIHIHQSESNSGHCESGSKDYPFDLHQSVGIQNQSSRKDTNSKEPEFATAPDDWGMKPHLINTENSCDAMPKVSHRDRDSAIDIKQSESASSQQHKPVPTYHDQNFETANEQQKSKPFSSEKSNSEREANNMDENNFLKQIRTKSLNLKPTVPPKPSVPSGSSTNVQIMTILHKANAIRQAVGSDDGDNWSDT